MSHNSTKLSSAITLKPGSAPSSPENGDIYYDNVDNKFYFRQNGSYIDISSGSGTVTSVSLSDSTGLFTITGSPVTVSGTLTLSALASQLANTFLAAPNGSAGAPSFRSMVAGDLPTITLTGNVTGSASGGSISTSISSNVVTNSMLSQMATNTIKGNNTGGTANALDLTTTQVTAMLNTFSSSLQGLAPASGGGTSNFLRADGTWAVPTGSSPGVTAIGTIDSQTKSANGAVIATTNLYLQSADASNPGVVTTGTQTFAGAKTFNTPIAVDSGGTGVASATISPTASAFAAWDANKNLSANSLISGYTTIATAAGTTTLSVSSTGQQYFTGSTTQTCKLPVVTTLANGQQFVIVNNSSGIVTVQTSGSNTIQAMAAHTVLIVTVIDKTAGTGTASWSWAYAATNNSTIGGGSTSPLTTKGDTWGYSSVDARVPVGSDYQSLIADSSQALGVRYASNYKGPKNYIQYCDFENNATTGWSLGTVGTRTNGIPTGSPTFGSGASGNLSISVVSSGQLSGTYSLSLASSAATTAGDMLASQSYAIDISDQAKVLTWRFNYSVPTNPSNGNFSGTSSNSFGVAIYDVTNSAWLSSTANFAMIQSSGVGYATGTCQTGATTANIRFVIYNANASSGAITLYFDDFYVGPQPLVNGPAIKDTVNAGTITITGTTSNPTLGASSVNNVSYQRRGDRAFISYNYGGTGTGSAGSGTYLFTLPAGLSFDSSIPNTGSTVPADSAVYASYSLPGAAVEFYNATTGPTAAKLQRIIPYSSTQFYVQLIQEGGISFYTVGSTAFPASATLGFSIGFECKIAGWSSNSVMSSDTDTRVVAMIASKASASVQAAADTSLTATYDSAGAWSGTQYIVPVAGVYQVGAAGQMSAVSSLSVWVNGSLYSLFGTAASTGYMSTGSMIVGNLKAGDTIALRCNSTTTSTNTVFTVNRLSGPAVVAATETVGCRYTNVTTVPGTVGVPIVQQYQNKDYDTHNAYNTSTGLYTCPVSGKYQVNASHYQSATTVSANQGIMIQINKNAVAISQSQTYFTSSTSRPQISAVSDVINCLAGDTLAVASGNAATTPSSNNSTTFTFLSIIRVGN